MPETITSQIAELQRDAGGFRWADHRKHLREQGLGEIVLVAPGFLEVGVPDGSGQFD